MPWVWMPADSLIVPIACRSPAAAIEAARAVQAFAMDEGEAQPELPEDVDVFEQFAAQEADKLGVEDISTCVVIACDPSPLVHI